jgi:hypothetical protein
MDSSEDETKPKLTRPFPSIRDFVLCEKVIRDQLYGKITLIDVFENVQSVIFPFHFRCWYYCTLTDGHGPFSFQVLLRNIESGKEAPIWDGTIILDPVKPAALVNVIAPIFEAPGLYEFVIRSANGKTVGVRTFTVIKLPNNNPVI